MKKHQKLLGIVSVLALVILGAITIANPPAYGDTGGSTGGNQKCHSPHGNYRYVCKTDGFTWVHYKFINGQKSFVFPTSSTSGISTIKGCDTGGFWHLGYNIFFSKESSKVKHTTWIDAPANHYSGNYWQVRYGGYPNGKETKPWQDASWGQRGSRDVSYASGHIATKLSAKDRKKFKGFTIAKTNKNGKNRTPVAVADNAATLNEAKKDFNTYKKKRGNDNVYNSSGKVVGKVKNANWNKTAWFCYDPVISYTANSYIYFERKASGTADKNNQKHTIKDNSTTVSFRHTLKRKTEDGDPDTNDVKYQVGAYTATNPNTDMSKAKTFTFTKDETKEIVKNDNVEVPLKPGQTKIVWQLFKYQEDNWDRNLTGRATNNDKCTLVSDKNKGRVCTSLHRPAAKFSAKTSAKVDVGDGQGYKAADHNGRYLVTSDDGSYKIKFNSNITREKDSAGGTAKDKYFIRITNGSPKRNTTTNDYDNKFTGSTYEWGGSKRKDWLSTNKSMEVGETAYLKDQGGEIVFDASKANKKLDYGEEIKICVVIKHATVIDWSDNTDTGVSDTGTSTTCVTVYRLQGGCDNLEYEGSTLTRDDFLYGSGFGKNIGQMMVENKSTNTTKYTGLEFKNKTTESVSIYAHPYDAVRFKHLGCAGGAYGISHHPDSRVRALGQRNPHRYSSWWLDWLWYWWNDSLATEYVFEGSSTKKIGGDEVLGYLWGENEVLSSRVAYDSSYTPSLYYYSKGVNRNTYSNYHYGFSSSSYNLFPLAAGTSTTQFTGTSPAVTSNKQKYPRAYTCGSMTNTNYYGIIGYRKTSSRGGDNCDAYERLYRKYTSWNIFGGGWWDPFWGRTNYYTKILGSEMTDVGSVITQKMAWNKLNVTTSLTYGHYGTVTNQDKNIVQTAEAKIIIPYNYQINVSAGSDSNASIIFIGENTELSTKIKVEPRKNIAAFGESGGSYATLTKPTHVDKDVFTVPNSYGDTIKVDTNINNIPNMKSLYHSSESSVRFNKENTNTGSTTTDTFAVNDSVWSKVNVGDLICIRTRVWPADSHNLGSGDVPASNNNSVALTDSAGTGYKTAVAMSCYTIGKKPTMSVEGANAFAGGNKGFLGSVSERDLVSGASYKFIFGSWSEYGLFGKVGVSSNTSTGRRGFASGAAYGYEARKSETAMKTPNQTRASSATIKNTVATTENSAVPCRFSPQTFANNKCSSDAGSELGTQGVGVKTAEQYVNRMTSHFALSDGSYVTNSATGCTTGSLSSINHSSSGDCIKTQNGTLWANLPFKVPTKSDTELGYEYYNVKGNAYIGSNNSRVNNNKAGTTRVYNVSGTLVINGNISITENAKEQQDVRNLSSNVIIAKNVYITGDVTTIDAIIVADKVNTCAYADGSAFYSSNNSDHNLLTGYNKLTGSLCTKQLVFNAPVAAKSIVLNRTGGAGAGTASIQRGEIFNMDMGTYLWAYQQMSRYGQATTTYLRELPTRY